MFVGCTVRTFAKNFGELDLNRQKGVGFVGLCITPQKSVMNSPRAWCVPNRLTKVWTSLKSRICTFFHWVSCNPWTGQNDLFAWFPLSPSEYSDSVRRLLDSGTWWISWQKIRWSSGIEKWPSRRDYHKKQLEAQQRVSHSPVLSAECLRRRCYLLSAVCRTSISFSNSDCIVFGIKLFPMNAFKSGIRSVK